MIFRKARPLAAALRAAFSHLTRPRTRHKEEVEAAPSEREGGGEAEHAEGQNLTAPPYEGEVQAQYPASGEAQQQEEAKQPGGDPYLRTQVRQNWIMVSATIIIAIATCITTVTGYYQWRAIREQLASADETSKQNERLISAMQKQADAATTQADASQTIAERNKDLVSLAGEQAKASQTQANASLDQAEAAKQSLGAAQTSARAAEQSAQVASQSFLIGERPYIAVKDAKFTNVVIGQKPIAEARFENGGRTPALNVRFRTYLALLTGFLPENPTYRPVDFVGNVFMQAGAEQVARIQADWVITEKEMEAINSGKYRLVIYGYGDYEDGLGKQHRFKFCGFYKEGIGGARPCPTHNNSN